LSVIKEFFVVCFPCMQMHITSSCDDNKISICLFIIIIIIFYNILTKFRVKIRQWCL